MPGTPEIPRWTLLVFVVTLAASFVGSLAGVWYARSLLGSFDLVLSVCVLSALLLSWVSLFVSFVVAARVVRHD